jgi:hypothetical protein
VIVGVDTIPIAAITGPATWSLVAAAPPQASTARTVMLQGARYIAPRSVCVIGPEVGE